MSGSRSLDFLGALAAKLQDAVGGRAGDAAAQAREQARDRADQAAGQVQDAYGEVLDTVERIASSRPLVTIAAAAGAGFVFGILVARR